MAELLIWQTVPLCIQFRCHLGKFAYVGKQSLAVLSFGDTFPKISWVRTEHIFLGMLIHIFIIFVSIVYLYNTLMNQNW